MMGWLLGDGLQWLIGAALAASTLIGSYLAGRKAGDAKRQKERADALEEHYRDLAAAADAGRGKLPDAANDVYNRDARPKG